MDDTTNQSTTETADTNTNTNNNNNNSNTKSSSDPKQQQKNDQQQQNDQQNDQQQQQNDPQYTPEDLIELINAIKFATPNASIRNVHKEISEVMSLHSGYEFLSQVKLNDVKKVWKKAHKLSASSGGGRAAGGIQTATQTATTEGRTTTTTTTTEISSSFGRTDIRGEGEEENNTLKLYTIGDGSVRTLARDYTSRSAASAAAAAAATTEEKTTTKTKDDDDSKNYVHAFLDIPLNPSGTLPYQALINFSVDNSPNRLGTGGGTGGGNTRAERRAKKRMESKKGSSNRNTTTTTAAAAPATTTTTVDGRDIVKIQVAAVDDDETTTEKDTLPSPMLLYNADRSARTFIHKHDDDDDGGHAYDKIRNLILGHGTGGALGDAGGAKGYFYCRVTKRPDGHNIVSIDVSSLAPPQPW